MAQPVAGPVTIQPERVWAAHGKLWVRTLITNGTDQPVVVDRDQIVARLPSGAVLHRAQGTYSQHVPYMIPPGAAHEVYVEFFGEGFSWRDVPQVQIDFSPGTTSNGQPMQVAPLAVSNGG